MIKDLKYWVKLLGFILIFEIQLRLCQLLREPSQGRSLGGWPGKGIPCVGWQPCGAGFETGVEYKGSRVGGGVWCAPFLKGRMSNGKPMAGI